MNIKSEMRIKNGMKKRDITILVIVMIVVIVCGVSMTFQWKEINPDDFKVTKELLSKVNEIEKSDKASNIFGFLQFRE